MLPTSRLEETRGLNGVQNSKRVSIAAAKGSLQGAVFSQGPWPICDKLAWREPEG